MVSLPFLPFTFLLDNTNTISNLKKSNKNLNYVIIILNIIANISNSAHKNINKCYQLIVDKFGLVVDIIVQFKT